MSPTHDEINDAIAESQKSSSALSKATDDLKTLFESEAAHMNTEFAAIDLDLRGMLADMSQESDRFEAAEGSAA